MTEVRKQKKPRHRAVPLVRERRTREAGLTFRNLEIEGAKGTKVKIVGTPIVYNQAYDVRDAVGVFEERMRPGVAGHLLNSDVCFLIDHDESRLLGRTVSGTMQLADDTTGLHHETVIDTRDTDASNLAIRIERGDISQMSCGFIVDDDDWNGAMDKRTINRFSELTDVSAVTYPASPMTSISIAQRAAFRLRPEARSQLCRAIAELRIDEELGLDRAAQIVGSLILDPDAEDLTYAIRLRRVYAELRAGKTLSNANENMILTAVQNLHSILDAAGSNPYSMTNGSPEDDGKGTVLPEEPTDDNMAVADDADDMNHLPADNGDGLAAEPLMDPGEQIRSKLSPDLMVAVRERKGRRRSQQHRESEELLRAAKLRIL